MTTLNLVSLRTTAAAAAAAALVNASNGERLLPAEHNFFEAT